MANTDRITGKDVYVTFAGTEISGDFTSVSFSEEGDMVDVTAGGETYHYYIPLDRTDGECTVEAFYGGSVVFNALAVNTAGTLIIAPKGTAATNPRYTVTRAIVKERSKEMPFDDGVTLSVTFQFSSALTADSY